MEQNQMTLSEAEVLIVQAQRAKDEAAKLEAIAYEAQQVKKAIDDAQKYLNDEVKEQDALYQSKLKYYNEIKSITSQVTLVVEDRTISRKPYYYKRVDGDLKSMDLEPITASHKTATLKVMGYEISVSRHNIYGHSRIKSSNFEMQIYDLYDSRYYKKASTIVSKITEIKAKKEASKQRADARDTARQDAYEDIMQQYPDAEVKLDRDYYRGSKGEYTDWDVLNIQLNGNKVQYRIYTNIPTEDKPTTYKLSFVKMTPAKTSIEDIMASFK